MTLINLRAKSSEEIFSGSDPEKIALLNELQALSMIFPLKFIFT